MTSFDMILTILEAQPKRQLPVQLLDFPFPAIVKVVQFL